MKIYKVTVDADGTIRWYNQQDQYHCEHGPAVTWTNGDKYWYLNGKCHRGDGPAFECANGDRVWFLDNKLHRQDGPAIEYADGDTAWYLDGRCLTEQQFLEQTRSCEGRVVDIDGKKYKLTAQ